MSKQLTEMLSDLGENLDLQAAYKKDPEAVMDKYGIEESERDLVRQKNYDGIRSKLGTDVKMATNGFTRIYK
ncbi:hypothetical protein [Pleionea sp. CnH1-48]|uniref:hypothetical protein n=1 Tax=Pleionea sp. CnH1-48 TaxID=2954494 RepID=UPI002096CC69|nr:hypothetical protein [Pleionea sp. CnH1-48]MCO7222927.1 hypothetical protein [Pleionea sp. CnH1-48]